MPDFSLRLQVPAEGEGVKADYGDSESQSPTLNLINQATTQIDPVAREL